MAETDRRVQVLANLRCLYPTYDLDVLTLSYPTTAFAKGTGYQAVAVKYDANGSSTSLMSGVGDAPSRKKAMQCLLKKTEEELLKLLSHRGFTIPLAESSFVLHAKSEEVDLTSEDSESFEFIATPEDSSSDEWFDERDTSRNSAQITEKPSGTFEEPKLSPTGFSSANHSEGLDPNDQWAFWVADYLKKQNSNETFASDEVVQSFRPSESAKIIAPDASNDNWAWWAAKHLQEKENQNRSSPTLKPRYDYPPGSGDQWAFWAAKHSEKKRESAKIVISTCTRKLKADLPASVPGCPLGSDDSWAFWASKQYPKTKVHGIQTDIHSTSRKSTSPKEPCTGVQSDPRDDWAFWASKHLAEQEKTRQLAIKESTLHGVESDIKSAIGTMPNSDYPPGSGDYWAYWVACKNEQLAVTDSQPGPHNMKENLNNSGMSAGTFMTPSIYNYAEQQAFQEVLQNSVTMGVPASKLKHLIEETNSSYDAAPSKPNDSPFPDCQNHSTKTTIMHGIGPDTADNWAFWANIALKEKKTKRFSDSTDSLPPYKE